MIVLVYEKFKSGLKAVIISWFCRSQLNTYSCRLLQGTSGSNKILSPFRISIDTYHQCNHCYYKIHLPQEVLANLLEKFPLVGNQTNNLSLFLLWVLGQSYLMFLYIPVHSPTNYFYCKGPTSTLCFAV